MRKTENDTHKKFFLGINKFLSAIQNKSTITISQYSEERDLVDCRVGALGSVPLLLSFCMLPTLQTSLHYVSKPLSHSYGFALFDKPPVASA
jgi:hypothetical protein